MRGAALPIAALLAAGCAASGRAPRIVAVETDGWAASEPGRSDSAARRAVADALRRAVEKAAGVSVSARTRLRDGVAVSEQMIADAAGCVRGYEVLSESSCAGGRCARVRARVETGAGSCSGRPVLPPAALEEAEVSVAYSGESSLDRAAAESAASELRGRLAGRGWRVVESEARFRLLVTASTRAARDERLGTLSSVRAVLRVRVEGAGGRVMQETTTEAAAVDAEPSSAARQAGAAAAEKAAGPAAEAMEEGLWKVQRLN